MGIKCPWSVYLCVKIQICLNRKCIEALRIRQHRYILLHLLNNQVFLISYFHALQKYCITLPQTNQGARLVYHPQLVAVYHQCEALYLIKPKGDTRKSVMIYQARGLYEAAALPP